MNQLQVGAAAEPQRGSFAIFRSSLFAAAFVFILLPGDGNTRLQAASRTISADLAAQEKEGCVNNLKAIYSAIEAYRRDHNELPNWFSDLVPDYLPDVNALVCPICLRTGQTEEPGLSDPHIASSYLFEFSPIPLGKAAPANPKATRRDWKRRQIEMVGSIVPVVRCRNHKPTLNLACDGRVYESPPSWETMLTNTVDPATLTIARMFAATTNRSGGNVSAPKKSYPPRDANASAQLLDLTLFFNARLTDTWHGAEGATGNDLSGLTAGVQELKGVEYDVRGVIQLGSKAANAARFPAGVTGIKVSQKCQKLHFLHSAAFGHAPDEGKQIGTFVLHFAENNMRMDVPIVYGKDVRDWHYSPTEKEADPPLPVAWKGDNPTSKRAGTYVRLFETIWTNPTPNVQLESIDFVSTMLQPAPFLVAITVE